MERGVRGLQYSHLSDPLLRPHLWDSCALGVLFGWTGGVRTLLRDKVGQRQEGGEGGTRCERPLVLTPLRPPPKSPPLGQQWA